MNSVTDFFYKQFCDNIPFYFLAIGLLCFVMYVKNESGLNKRGIIVLLVACTSLSVFSSLDRSIGSYVNVVTNNFVNSGFTTMKEYGNSIGINLDAYNSWHHFFAALSYSIRIILSMVSYIVINREDNYKFKTLLAIPSIITIIVFISSPFTKSAFYFDNVSYVFHRGPYYFLIYLAIFINVFFVIYELYKRYSNNIRTLSYLVCLVTATTILSIHESMDVFNTDVDIVSMLFLATIVLYYILMESHIYYEEMEEKEKALYESKVTVMTNQVRPHFIFNCIGNIVELCEENSKAKKALLAFSKYLRVNINSLNETRPMLFDNELMYIENYVSLEKMRYADKFEVNYDVRVTDFLVPLISIEIFVENAIKHNVGKKDLIHVSLKTLETDRYYEIEIIDDGVGFDISVLDDEEKSVGTRNAIYRLKNMVSADVTIDSVSDIGTDVIIKIPKGKDEE